LTTSCRQRSWTLDEVKKPLHVETGYVRVPNPEKVELVIAQPTGDISKIDSGRKVTQVDIKILNRRYKC
jgi:hypothetical protein